jgi:hypothetical protein
MYLDPYTSVCNSPQVFKVVGTNKRREKKRRRKKPNKHKAGGGIILTNARRDQGMIFLPRIILRTWGLIPVSLNAK